MSKGSRFPLHEMSSNSNSVIISYYSKSLKSYQSLIAISKNFFFLAFMEIASEWKIYITIKF